MRNLTKNEFYKVSGGKIEIKHSGNEFEIKLLPTGLPDTVLFNNIGLGSFGWCKGPYDPQKVIFTQSVYNGYKIDHKDYGHCVIFRLTPN